MRVSAEPVRSPSVVRLAVCASLAMATAGCSGDTNRFDQPFSNPFSSQPQAEANAARAGAACKSRRKPAAAATIAIFAAASAPQYQQPPRATAAMPPPAAARPVPPRPVASASAAMEWNGGTPITVSQGETIQSISHRYGVPPLAVAEANGMTTGTPIYPGQRLVIPKYSYGQAAAVPPPPAPSMRREPQLASAPAITGSVRNAPQAGGSCGQSRRDAVQRRRAATTSARWRWLRPTMLPPHHQVRMGERLNIPGAAGSRVAQQAPRPARRSSRAGAGSRCRAGRSASSARGRIPARSAASRSRDHAGQG